MQQEQREAEQINAEKGANEHVAHLQSNFAQLHDTLARAVCVHNGTFK